MRLSKEKYKEIINAIRREMVTNPYITIYGLQASLEKEFNNIFDKNFIAKMKNKIHSERAKRIGVTVKYYLSAMEDEFNLIKEKLWEIIEDKNANTKNIISAMRELRQIDMTFFDALLNADIFALNTSPQDKKLTPEQEERIQKALAYVTSRTSKLNKPLKDDRI